MRYFYILFISTKSSTSSVFLPGAYLNSDRSFSRAQQAHVASSDCADRCGSGGWWGPVRGIKGCKGCSKACGFCSSETGTPERFWVEQEHDLTVKRSLWPLCLNKWGEDRVLPWNTLKNEVVVPSVGEWISCDTSRQWSTIQR